MKTEADFNTSEHYGNYLRENPDLLEVRKREVAILNSDTEAIISDCECETCGSMQEHPDTGYCFICDTDNWKFVQY